MRASVFFAVLVGAVCSLSLAVGAKEVRPPLGLQLFCLQNPASCKPSHNTSLRYSNEVGQLLLQVNRQFNNSIKPRADRFETWSETGSSGDCEDYVLAKRATLVRAGIPAGALRIAYTTTRAGEAHAILVVVTDRGDFVLDNLSARVLSVAEAGYSIHRISSGDLLGWVAYN
ncbi:transglutaminase-like cysteine peptidase [Devosia nitrariae]|uniref:transglutaminase-like cysteine peptidase n=1 Tax=Devosia nitrariae TaxID=2071872 RepID=UPI0024E0E681|nr:transglutaminase-like cysteine peptidase [Devosia nitrariae]